MFPCTFVHYYSWSVLSFMVCDRGIADVLVELADFFRSRDTRVGVGATFASVIGSQVTLLLTNWLPPCDCCWY